MSQKINIKEITIKIEMRTISLCMLFLSFCQPVFAQDNLSIFEQTCLKLPQTIDVDLQIGNTYIQNSVNVQDMNQYYQKSTNALPEHGVIGFLDTSFDTNAKNGVLTAKNQTQSCYKISYQYHLKLNDMTIYIPQEFSPNSCMYNDVLRHENVHKAITINGFNQMKQSIEEYLKNTLENQYFVGSQQEGLNRVEIIKQNINIIAETYKEIMNQKHQEFDAAEDYKNSQTKYAQCKNS